MERKSEELASSPAGTGPAGPVLESKVAAIYMLAMLRDEQPRGLPGTVIDWIELQGAASGHPLDDVIVHCRAANKAPATLEIQVKRSLTFAPKDQQFKKVCKQLAEAMREISELSRWEFAVAVDRTVPNVRKYSDVLEWARTTTSAKTFWKKIRTPGKANEAMRRFAETIGNNLAEAGFEHDDDFLWKLFGRFQIHEYDFTAIALVQRS